MNKEILIDEVSSVNNLSREEAESAYDRLVDAFQDVRAAFSELVQQISDMINEVMESIQSINEEKNEFVGTGKPISLKEFLLLISKAHQASLEEEKKPPDNKNSDTVGK